jgi:hypothetical protein
MGRNKAAAKKNGETEQNERKDRFRVLNSGVCLSSDGRHIHLETCSVR